MKHLRRKIVEREEHIKELSSRIQPKRAHELKENSLSRPVNTIEAHLRYQIQRKEVENDELKLKTQVNMSLYVLNLKANKLAKPFCGFVSELRIKSFLGVTSIKLNKIYIISYIT